MKDWQDRGWLTLDELKQTVTLHDVAEMLELEVTSGNKIHSPFNPGERTPSLHLYEDSFYDYSTGKWGDIVDLVQAYHPDMTMFDVVKSIGRKALRAGKEPGDVEKSEPKQLMDFTDELQKIWPHDPAGRAFYERQLGVSLPGNVVIGFNRDVDEGMYPLLIPHQDQDGVYGVKVREPGGAKSAWPGSQFSHRLYDPAGWRLWRSGPYPVRSCVITEGESDCWAMSAKLPYHRILALPSGASCWKDHWLPDLEPFERIVIVMDNNQAGKTARDKIAGKVGHLRAEHLYVPQLYDDAREAINAGWEPEHPCLR